MPTYRVFDTSVIPTTEDLLNEFMVNMVATAQGVTDISIGSKMWALGYTIARQHSSIYYTLHFYRKQSFVVTATGKYLDLHGIEVGVLRHLATYATGEVLFYRDSPATIDIVIPAGTIVTTPIVSSNSPPLKYSTIEDIVLSAGSVEVSVYAKCLTAGSTGNIPTGTINRLESTLPGAQRVSGGTMSGGLEIEDDDSYRERILTAWAARETGTTAAIRNAILSVAGIRNVMIVDPARTRVGQYMTIYSSVTNQEQLTIETLSSLEAKYDIVASLLYEDTGLTLNIKQINEKGEVVAEEIVPDITSGWDLLDKINSWSQSGTLYLSELFLDDNPYDDPVKQSTDNEIVAIRTIAPLGGASVSLIIEDIPIIDPDTNETIAFKKNLTISTETRYKHNQILGQTEMSPLIEKFEGLTSYGNMVDIVNDADTGSKLIKMTLLDIKYAAETLNPEPYIAGQNIVRTSFTPVIDIIDPVHEDIQILDADAGIIAVGQIASPFTLEYNYRAKIVDNEGVKTEFGEIMPENIVLTLQTDGSEIVAASPVFTPDIVSNTGLSFCEELPATFAQTSLQSIYKMIRGRIDVTIVPYSLTETPDPTLIQEVISACQKVRAAGVEVNIIYPNTQLVDISVTVEVVSNVNYQPSQFYDIIRTNITNYINSLQMGEPAYVDKITAVSNPTVTGLKVAHVLSPSNDINVSATAFLRVGNIFFNS